MSKDFDKIFKSKLENHSSSYPTDMWDNIDAAINPPKRNTRVWWFSFLAIGIVVLISGFLYLDNYTTGSYTETLSDLSSEAKEPNLLTKLNSKSGIVVKSKAITQVASADVSDVTSPSSKISSSTAKKNNAANQIKDVTNSFTRTINSSTLGTKNSTSSNSIVKKNSINTLETFNIESKKPINKRKITFTEPLLSFDSRSQSEEIVVPSQYGKVEKTNRNIEFKSELSTILNPSNDFNKTYASEQLNYKNIASLPSISDLMFQESKPLLDLEVAVPSRTDCPSWVREKLGLYLEAYYAPEFGIRSLTAKDRDSTIMAHQDSRNATEKSLISYSLGARALFLTPSGISFKLGLNYAQINERFTWQDPESIREITIVDTDPMTGDTLNSYVTYEYSKEIEERINRYKSIDLALLVGYEKHYRKNLSFSMNAGIYLNLLAKQRGMFIDPTGERSWFSSDDGTYDVYKRSVGVSFFASGGLMYHWVDGIDFFAEPSLRFYTQSMTLNDYPLNQNYVVLGLHTGIRYKF